MFKYIIIIIIIIIIIWKVKNHIHIKYKTFFRKGFYKTSKPYGVYCYCGKQGKGKTYSVVEYLLDHSDTEIYCNISSIQGINYHYINGIDELLSLRDKTNCIIVFDEIFTILQKGTKMSGDILDFLSQMRKREMIFITTAQEWLEINMTLRRYCRYQIECNMFSILGYPILTKRMYDAEQMKWSQEDNEYIAPIVSTTISHGLKRVIDSYNTYEQIGQYAKIQYKNTSNFNLLSEDIQIPLKEETIENEVAFAPLSEEQTTEGTIELHTTTNSNSIVNSQLTNILHNDLHIKVIDTSANFDNIDNDFWGNIKDSDFEENVK